MFNNVGTPTPRLGAKLEDHTVEDFDRLAAVNLRGVFLGCKQAVLHDSDDETMDQNGCVRMPPVTALADEVPLPMRMLSRISTRE